MEMLLPIHKGICNIDVYLGLGKLTMEFSAKPFS